MIFIISSKGRILHFSRVVGYFTRVASGIMTVLFIHTEKKIPTNVRNFVSWVRSCVSVMSHRHPRVTKSLAIGVFYGKLNCYTFWTETLQGHSFIARIADGQMSVNPPRSSHILSDTDPGSSIGPHYSWSGAINTGFNVNNLAYIAKNLCFTGHF